jgi:hypothetical protein
MTAVPVGVSARRRERSGTADVDDQIVVMDTVGEGLAGVVDDPIGTETCYQVEIPGAGYPGDVGSGGLGQLHGVAADATRSADDQDPLSRLELVGEFVLGGHGVLGEGALAHPEHRFAHRKSGDRWADRDDGAGDVQAGHSVLRPAEPEPHHPHQVRRPCHQVPGPPIQTGRAPVPAPRGRR